MNSNKKTARIAGVLFLLVGLFGGFAEGYMEPLSQTPDASPPTC